MAPFPREFWVLLLSALCQRRCCEERVQCVDGALVSGRQAADDVAAALSRGSDADHENADAIRKV